MKKLSLIAASALLLFVSACKKDDNSISQTEYPITYRYTMTANTSATSTYTENGLIANTPKSLSNDSFLVRSQSQTAAICAVYSIYYKLVSANQIEYGTKNGADTIRSYTVTGNKLNITGTDVYLILENEQIRSPYYTFCRITSGGKEGKYGPLEGSLTEAMKAELAGSSDTASARTFDLLFKKE